MKSDTYEKCFYTDMLMCMLNWSYYDWVEPRSIVRLLCTTVQGTEHNDIIKWKHFPRDWPFVRGIYRSPVNSSHKCQWRGALIFSLICIWNSCWVNNGESGDLRCHRFHYGIIVMRSSALRITSPDRTVHGANMGPIWGRQDPGGPHVGTMNFVIWVCSCIQSNIQYFAKLCRFLCYKTGMYCMVDKNF